MLSVNYRPSKTYGLLENQKQLLLCLPHYLGVAVTFLVIIVPASCELYTHGARNVRRMFSELSIHGARHIRKNVQSKYYYLICGT